MWTVTGCSKVCPFLLRIKSKGEAVGQEKPLPPPVLFTSRSLQYYKGFYKCYTFPPNIFPQDSLRLSSPHLLYWDFWVKLEISIIKHSSIKQLWKHRAQVVCDTDYPHPIYASRAQCAAWEECWPRAWPTELSSSSALPFYYSHSPFLISGMWGLASP